MDTQELYLILHKVRGEPAFDIAQKMVVEHPNGDNEIWWIIPTSGHRAYPVQYWLLSTHGVPELEDAYSIVPIPNDWPDHYEAKRDDGHHLVDAAREILMRKGLISAAKPNQPLYRRF